MRNIRGIVVILSMVVLFLIGCGGDDSSPKTEYIRGWVFAEFPISGATVSIFDSNNVQLNTKVETNDEGTFLIGIKGLPKNFRVIVTEGKEGSQEFAAELKTGVNNFDPETDIIYVNVVTTMVSTYLDKHPEKTLDEATTIIKDFLKIPETVDIGESLHNSGQYFSHMAFMAEAERNGGVNSFIEILLAELESDPTKTHPFYSTQLFAGDTSDIVTKMLDKIAEGAISSAGGKLFGWALKMFGTGGDYSEVQDTLEEIKTMISQLSDKMDSIYEQLSAQITQTDYNIRIGQINPLMSKIKSTSDSLSFLVTVPQNPVNEKWIASEIERIKRIIGEQILPQASEINNQLVGIGGAEGLIKVWSRIVKNKHRFLGPDDSKQIQAQFDYFDAIQLSLLELTIEYYHATDAPDQLILNAIEQYKNNRTAQISMKPLPIPKDAIIETHTGLMIHPYDVWNALRIASDPANVPRGYIAADAHTYDHIFFYARGAYNYNVHKLLGFDKWRMPTSSEGKHMFELWSGKGVGTWAISQGYPKDCFDNGNRKDCIDDNKLILLMDSTDRPGGMPAQQYWKFQTKDGQILKACNISCYRGYSCAHSTIGGILIPVRSLGAGEFYYW
jgi:hypothetical protein